MTKNRTSRFTKKLISTTPINSTIYRVYIMLNIRNVFNIYFNDKEQRHLRYIPENVRIYMREPTGIYP